MLHEFAFVWRYKTLFINRTLSPKATLDVGLTLAARLAPVILLRLLRFPFSTFLRRSEQGAPQPLGNRRVHVCQKDASLKLSNIS